MDFNNDDQCAKSQPMEVEHIVPEEEELKIVPQKSYECEICGFCVKTKANLWVHRVKTHRIVKTDSDVAFLYRTKRNVKKIFHCPVTGCKYQDAERGFPKYSALRQHYIWVHGTRDHICSICFRLFPSATLLERHRLTCGQAHICATCGRRYSELKYLKQHLKRSNHQMDNNKVATSSHMHIGSVGDMSGAVKISSRPNFSSCQSPDFNHVNTEAQSSGLTPVTTVQTLQPIILPVVVPLAVPSDFSKDQSNITVETSGITDAIVSALRPVIERMSNETATQASSKIHQQASSMVQVAIAPSPCNEVEEKKISAGVSAHPFVDISTSLDRNTIGIGTDINPLLQPVGSQTEDLFDYDRTCLHVETQTCSPVGLLMTQTSPQLTQHASSVVQVPMAQSSDQLEDKKMTANVASEAFFNIPTSLSQSTVGLGTDIHVHPLLQPVGSQTEDLFDAAYDRTCLHVETQTCEPVVDVFSDTSRNLQTPQPPMVSTQTLVSNNGVAECLINMETQTDPIVAWIEAELSDIETQTSVYDLERIWY